jgi:hypothetical protein
MARGFPSKRVEAYREGITATIFLEKAVFNKSPSLPKSIQEVTDVIDSSFFLVLNNPEKVVKRNNRFRFSFDNRRRAVIFSPR